MNDSKISYIIPCAISAFICLGGGALIGTSASVTPVPVVIAGSNKVVKGNVPNRNRDLSWGLGALMFLTGGCFFHFYYSNGTEEILIGDGSSNGSLGGEKTILQPDNYFDDDDEDEDEEDEGENLSKQPTILDTAPVPISYPSHKNPLKSQLPKPSENFSSDYSKLLCENLIILLGVEKGSGKTSRAGYFIREFIKRGYQVKVTTTLLYAGQFAGVDVGGAVQTGQVDEIGMPIQDFSPIEERILWFINEISLRIENCRNQANYRPLKNEHKIVLVLDELSKYAHHLKPAVMRGLWTILVQDIRQMNAAVVLCTHGLTLDMLGGEEALRGKRDTVNNGACWVKLNALTDPNSESGKVPSPYVEVGKIRKSDFITEETYEMPLEETAPPPNYDYRALVAMHCPQFMPDKDLVQQSPTTQVPTVS